MIKKNIKKILISLILLIIILLPLTSNSFGYSKINLYRIPDNKGGYGIDITGLDVGDTFYIDNIECEITSIKIK